MYGFYAMMARMKYIERWALMRNSREENLSEHSLEVAMLAHSLAIISKERLGIDIDPAEVALMGVYHLKLVKPVYQASTELYITSTDSVISLQDLQLGSALTADYQSIITSRSVLNRVISDLELNVDYKTLGKMISVSNPTGTHIIHTNVKTN
ncbi:MAG: hypothetical protein IJL75_01635, partial [Eubacterium sp.]|nr:hypothetical protein [Eubacterium sp.]